MLPITHNFPRHSKAHQDTRTAFEKFFLKFCLYLQQEVPDADELTDRNHTDPVSELDDFGNLMKAMGAGISFDPFVKNESDHQNDGKRRR